MNTRPKSMGAWSRRGSLVVKGWVLVGATGELKAFQSDSQIAQLGEADRLEEYQIGPGLD